MSTAIKTHQAVRGTVADPSAFRSLCGRSSGRVIRVSDIAIGANVADSAEEITCKFCLALLAGHRVMAAPLQRL